MTPHIKADKNDFAKIVLMPGDPLRAKYIANKFLKNVKLVNDIRNILMYTGEYKGKKISIASSGMGCPSIGIYSYELFKFYDVDVIIRIGTTGSYVPDIKVNDVVNVRKTYSESMYAKMAANLNINILEPTLEIYELLNNTAQKINIPMKNNVIAHSCDSFYTYDKNLYKKHSKIHKTQVVEMESFALFTNAKLLNKKAACLLSVSDSFYEPNIILDPKERETKLDNMIIIALEASLNLK